MPVFAAAVCPHPPIVVPEIASGAAAELDDLRACCDAAVATLYEVRPDALVVVGTGSETAHHGSSGAGSFAPWGVNLRVGSSEPAGRPLPLSLTVGAWLLDRNSTAVRESSFKFEAVAADASPDECEALGVAVGQLGERVAVLVMGDGSACRGDHAPGYPDPRAEAFDAAVARALATADASALLTLDPVVAAELRVSGRAAWQVLANAVSGRRFVGELRYAAAPYGVGYFVTNWRAA